jgi:hypothetical protein
MVALYVFSVVLGGGFLAMSVLGDLLGGHGDVDMDAGGLDMDAGGFDMDAGGLDMDAGGFDMDAGGLDMDAGGFDLDAGGLDMDAGHLDVDTAHAELHADAGHLAAKIFSIRTVFYSLFGFGAVGSLLTFVWTGDPLLTAGFAVLGGISSGAVINAAFGYVRRSESGHLLTEGTYRGLRGRVTLPIRQEVAGKVVVERGGRRIELRALPHATAKGDPSKWQNILIVEMEKGVARVAPIEEQMLLEP